MGLELITKVDILNLKQNKSYIGLILKVAQTSTGVCTSFFLFKILSTICLSSDIISFLNQVSN